MARLAFLLPLLLTSARYLGWNVLTRNSGRYFSFTLSYFRAFYVPGVAPTDYKEGDDVDVKAVKMTSAHTQVSAALSLYLMSTAPWKERADCINWPYHDMSRTVSYVTHLCNWKCCFPLSARYPCVLTFCFHSCPLSTTPCPCVSLQMEWDSTAVRTLDKSSGEQKNTGQEGQ